MFLKLQIVEFWVLISECIAKMSSQTKFQPNRARNSDFSKMALIKNMFLKCCVKRPGRIS